MKSALASLGNQKNCTKAYMTNYFFVVIFFCETTLLIVVVIDKVLTKLIGELAF